MQLEDLGLIGNCQFSALIHNSGEIVWESASRSGQRRLGGWRMVTAVRVRQPVLREKHAQIRVGHARFSGPIRNKRARLCPPKLGQRQTIEVLADSAASTSP